MVDRVIENACTTRGASRQPKGAPMFHAFSPSGSDRLYIETADPSDGTVVVSAKIGDLAVAAWSEDRATDPSARGGVRVTNREAWSNAGNLVCDGCSVATSDLTRVRLVFAGDSQSAAYCRECMLQPIEETTGCLYVDRDDARCLIAEREGGEGECADCRLGHGCNLALRVEQAYLEAYAAHPLVGSDDALLHVLERIGAPVLDRRDPSFRAAWDALAEVESTGADSSTVATWICQWLTQSR